MSVANIQAKSAAVIRTADALVSASSHERETAKEKFEKAMEELDATVRSLQTGVEVGATADKLFRQANLLNKSKDELVAAVLNGGSPEPYLTRVKNGSTNVQKTAQQLLEESA